MNVAFGVLRMILDLKKFFSGEAERFPFAYEMDLSDMEWSGQHPFVSPVTVEGSVFSGAGEAVLEAEASFEFSMPCDRCMEIIREQRVSRFSHVLVPRLENEENDAYICVEGDSLDLDELLRTDILLEIPSKFLCREDCKGLCPSCGKNLNNGPCGCNLHQVDPRLEALRKLID